MEAIGNPGGHPADDSNVPTRSDLPSHDQREHLPSLYLLLLFLIVAGGIVTAGYLFYRSYARNFRGEVERELSSIAELKAGQLVQWRKERLMDASVYYRNRAFSGLVERLLETPADTNVRGWILSWLDRVQDAYRYDRVFILDAQGIERLAVPETPEPVASHLLQQIPEILRSNKITFLDFHRDTPDRPIHLGLVVPIREEPDGGRPLGVLVLHIDPAVYLYPFIRQWPTPSRTAEALLVRREGDEALFLNDLRFRKNSALSLRVPLNKGDAPAVKAALGQEGIVEGNDYRGVPVLADLRRVPDSPWFLVTCMDTTEVNAPLREWLWMIIGLVAVLLFGAGAGVGLIWRQQRLRFFRERLAAAKRIYAVSSHQEALLSAVPDIIMEVAQNKVYTWANPAGIEFFGEDVIGKEAAFYFEGEQETYQIVKPLFNGHDDVIYVESWQRRKDGEKRLLAWRCRVLKDDSGRVTGAISSAHDITERKRAEAELRESERKFRETMKYLDEGYYSVTPDGLLLDHNQAYNLNLGFDIGQDLRGLKTPDFWQNPDDRKTYLNELMTKGFIRNYLVNVKKINGEKIVVMLNSHLEKDKEGRPVRIEGTFTDFTERKRAEEALRLSYERFQLANRATYNAIWDWDLRTNVLWWNENFQTLFGSGAEEIEPSIESWTNRIHPEDLERVRTGIHEAIDLGRHSWSDQYRFRRKDGLYAVVDDRGYISRQADGNPVRMIGAMQDITERKRNEETIKRQLDEITFYYDNAPIGLAVLDTDLRYIRINRLLAEINGIPAAEHIGKTVKELVPALEEQARKVTSEIIRTGKPIKDLEFSGETAAEPGVKRFFMESWLPIKSGSEKITGFAVIVQDITERKQVEEALRRTEENFRHSLDDSPLGVRIVTAEGETIYANRVILDIYGFRSLEELRTTPVEKRYTAESYAEFKKRYERRQQGEDSPSEYDVSIVRKNGEVRHLLVSRKELLWSGKKQYQTIYRDITERKRSEEELRTSLREKEVLLREIHHRVKNNMQVISSLFNLQAGYTKNEECRGILKEGQMRIRSMSLVHEKLYQSRDLSKIDFAGYIQSLAVHLLHVYLVNPAQVRMETDFEDVSLDINSAVPCGLILNELVSNALKHAFPEGRIGVIKIGLRRGPGSAVELRVADDGVGLPKGLDFRKAESFGLQIVNLLVDQLEAAIDLDRTKGTAFTMTFRKLKYAPRT